MLDAQTKSNTPTQHGPADAVGTNVVSYGCSSQPQALAETHDCGAVVVRDYSSGAAGQRVVIGCKGGKCANPLCRREFARRRAERHGPRLASLASVAEVQVEHVVLGIGVQLRKVLTLDDVALLRKLAVKALRAGVRPGHRKHLGICATVHPAGEAGTWQPHVDAWVVPVALDLDGRPQGVPLDTHAVRTAWVSGLRRVAVSRGRDPETVTAQTATVWCRPGGYEPELWDSETESHTPLQHALWRDMRSFPCWAPQMAPRALAVQAYGLARGWEPDGEDDCCVHTLETSELPKDADPVFFAELDTDAQSRILKGCREERNAVLSPDDRKLDDDGSDDGSRAWRRAGEAEVFWYAHRPLRSGTDAEVIANALDPESKVTDLHVAGCLYCRGMLRAITGRDIGKRRASDALFARWQYLRHLMVFGLSLADPGECPKAKSSGHAVQMRLRLDGLIAELDNAGVVLGDVARKVKQYTDATGPSRDRLSDWQRHNPKSFLI